MSRAVSRRLEPSPTGHRIRPLVWLTSAVLLLQPAVALAFGGFIGDAIKQTTRFGRALVPGYDAIQYTYSSVDQNVRRRAISLIGGPAVSTADRLRQSEEARRIGGHIARNSTILGHPAIDASRRIVDASLPLVGPILSGVRRYLPHLADQAVGRYGAFVVEFGRAFAQGAAPHAAMMKSAIDGGVGDRVKVALEAVLPRIPRLQQYLDSADRMGMGSFLFIVSGSASPGGVAAGYQAGIAVDVKALKHATRHRSFNGYPGNILSFFTVKGVMVGPIAGGGVDFVVGVHANPPAEVGGPALDVGAEFKAAVGGSVGVGFDASKIDSIVDAIDNGLQGDIPQVLQLTVGAGGGARFALGVGSSYCDVMGMLGSTGRFVNPSNHPTGPAARATGDPETYWNANSWDVLGSDAQRFWALLGWNKQRWDGPARGYPGTVHKKWHQLQHHQRQVAAQLGYDQRTWDATLPDGGAARVHNGGPDRYWAQFRWAQLGPTNQAAWRGLGWHQRNWDSRTEADDPPTIGTRWQHLRPPQQRIAALLGYDARLWNATVPGAPPINAYMLARDGSVLRWTGAGENWQPLGRQGRQLVVHRGQPVVVAKDGKTIWHFVNNRWVRIGSRADQLAIGKDGSLYAVNHRGIWHYDGTPDRWSNRGSTALSVAVQGNIYAVKSGGVVSERLHNGVWRDIGGASRVVVAGSAGIFVINRDNHSIWRYSGSPHRWDKIRDNAEQIVVDGNTLYAIERQSRRVLRRIGNGGWEHIGNHATHLSADGGGLAVVSTDGTIWRFNGTPHRWSRIGAGASAVHVTRR